MCVDTGVSKSVEEEGIGDCVPIAGRTPTSRVYTYVCDSVHVCLVFVCVGPGTDWGVFSKQRGAAKGQGLERGEQRRVPVLEQETEKREPSPQETGPPEPSSKAPSQSRVTPPNP